VASPSPPEALSAGGQRRRRPLGRADLPPSSPLLGPELDCLIPGDLLAVLEQWRLARDQFANGELQGLGVDAVAN